MTVSRTRLVATAALLFILTTQGTALAGEPANANDKSLAEALFRAAKDLQADGKLPEACAKFAESHRLDPKPGTILNVAACHELEGRTATAWADYSEAVTFAARARQSDREKLARAKVDDLAKKLSYVTFTFPEVKDLEILLDGKTLSTAAAGTRVPIDPGEHGLEARAPGKLPWTVRVKITPGPAQQTVVVPALADDPAGTAPAVVAPVPAAGPPPAGDAGPGKSSGSTQRVIGWVALGVGVVAVGGGAFFGFQTLSKKSTVDEHCAGTRCDAAGLTANDDAKTDATLSTIAFAVGGVAVVTGLVLLLTAPSARTAASFPRARGLQGVW